MSLQKKLVFTYLLVAIAPMFLAALLFQTNSTEELSAVQQRALEGLADIKVGVVRDYFNRFREEMSITKNRFIIRTDLPIVSRLAENTGSFEYKQARARLNERTNTLLKEWTDIDSILFVNPAGVVVYNTKPQSEKISINELFPHFGLDAFENGKSGVYITDIYPDQRGQDFNFLVSAPIYDFNNNFSGVVIFEANARQLYGLIQNVKGMGKTGETLLVKRVSDITTSTFSEHPYAPNGNYVLFLNPLRSNSDAAFNLTYRIGDNSAGVPAQLAAQGQEGSGISVDYRGKQVLAVWRYLPEYHWGLVAKIDMAEVLSPVSKVAGTLIFFGLISILAILFVSWLLARTISSPILELTEISEKIGRGDFSVKFSKGLLSAGGETGMLANAFASTTAKLRDLYENLEKKVKERTEKSEQSEAKLKEALSDSERANKLMVGRELEMIKLKKEIAEFKNGKSDSN